MHRAFQARGEELRQHIRPGAPFDQTVGDFCAECNSGWMSDLETTAEPVLTPLICDEACTLDVLEQDLIAVWATKTVLTAAPTNLDGTELISQEAYRWFGDYQRPLPGSLIWLGRYTGEGQWPTSLQFHGIAFVKGRPDEMPPDAKVNGFHAVLAVGHLALCVFQADVPDGPIVRGASDEKRLLIWPVTAAATRWPPQTSFGNDRELRDESRRTPDGIQAPLPGP